MNDLPRPGTVPDHLEAALEASFDTLVALALIQTWGADAIWGAEGQATEAIKSLRRAIAELRSACAHRSSALAHGFVIGAR